MTKITITVEDKEQVKLIYDALSKLKFIKTLQSEEVYPSLEHDEIQMLEERWDSYVASPEKSSTWESIKAEVLKKHA